MSGEAPFSPSLEAAVPWEPLDVASSDVEGAMNKEGANSALLKVRWIFPLLLAMVGTLSQYFFVRSLMEGSPSFSHSGNVVALGGSLSAGGSIRLEDLVPAPLSPELCAKGFIPWEKAPRLVGRRVRTGVLASEPLQLQDLVAQNLEPAFPERIPLGKRLYILNANLGVLAGVLKRGDRIDVVGNLELPGKGFVTKTLLQGATVVALGIPTRERGGDNALSLYLDPRDVEFLVHAQRLGTLSVVLRNPGDVAGDASADGMTETQFLNDKRIQDVYDGDLFRIQKGAAEP